MRERVVVVAAKAPQAGMVKTRLTPALTPRDAVRLAGAFLADTLHTVTEPFLRADAILALDGDVSGLREAQEFLGASPAVRIRPQHGNSLGERLVEMTEAAFAEGYRRVCVVGSDAPHLPAAFLLEAFGRLEKGADAVLGPADDGGYYLIALPRPTPALFAEIPWGGPEVCETTLRRAADARLGVALLPPWYDVDTPDDLGRLRTDLRRGVVQAPATQRVLETLTL